VLFTIDIQYTVCPQKSKPLIVFSITLDRINKCSKIWKTYAWVHLGHIVCCSLHNNLT